MAGAYLERVGRFAPLVAAKRLEFIEHPLWRTYVFVYHEGGASFKESRLALQANALQAIRRLHPGYEDMIREFVQRDPARPFREALDLARSSAQAAS